MATAKTTDKDAAKDAADAAKDAAKSVTNAAQATAEQYTGEAQGIASRYLDDFSDAIAAAGDTLNERDHSGMSRLVRESANGLSNAANALREGSPSGAIKQVEQFARTNPTTFVVGALLAGVAAGRFLKASTPRDDHDFDERSPTHPAPAVKPANPLPSEFAS